MAACAPCFCLLSLTDDFRMRLDAKKEKNLMDFHDRHIALQILRKAEDRSLSHRSGTGMREILCGNHDRRVSGQQPGAGIFAEKHFR